MGVPSFYRWLVNKYPNVIANAKEAKAAGDTSDPNPNGIEFDNLYLDMNGIIHPCFHPEDNHVAAPNTFDEVFERIFDNIDRLFQIVRPRKLLYLAIDGVAPRAKMNQQRSRRFRTAKDAEMADAQEEKVRKEFEGEGRSVLPKLQSEVSDSNTITPGTEFMDRLSKALQFYVRSRLENDPGWKHVKVLLSDSNVPGEGEHKIMRFIRLQRNLLGYEPNTRHCLYGLDADLIMLALASHEPHFAILREELFTQSQVPRPSSSPNLVPYQFLHIWALRDYLELELRIPDPPFTMDIERVIDDFIFLCFFAGNDFLPHIPSLNIHEGAIDLLMAVYRDKFKSLGGYLVDMEKVNDKKAAYVKLKRVETFILAVGAYEERIFKKREILKERMIRNSLRKMASEAREQDAEKEFSLNQPLSHLQLDRITEPSATTLHNDEDVVQNTKELEQKVKDFMREQNDLLKQGLALKDKVKLGLPGWKYRYYKEKFLVDDIESIRQVIVKKYTEGLCWVLEYYFSGVPSWTWYYPYHYGPFASDFKSLGSTNIKFKMGVPFKPFDQLMAVLPPRSVSALPEPYWRIMTSEESNLADFYPTDFEVDADGKRFLWQGTAKLPFINEERLLIETKKVEHELKDVESRRNSERADLMFISQFHNLIPSILLCNSTSARVPIDVQVSAGLNGYVFGCSEEFVDEEDGVMCVQYELPDPHPHIPRLVEKVELPEKAITEDDILKTPLWHEYEGWEPPLNRSQIILNIYKQATCVKGPVEPEVNNNRAWRGRGRTDQKTSLPDLNLPASTGFCGHNDRWSPHNSYNNRSCIQASFSGKDSSSRPSYGTRGPSYVAQRWNSEPSNQASWRSNTEKSGSSSNMGDRMESRGSWRPRNAASTTSQKYVPVSVGRGLGRGSPETPSVVSRGWWGRGSPQAPAGVGRGCDRGSHETPIIVPQQVQKRGDR